MDKMLAADLSVDRYMTYIVTRSVKASQPNLVKLVAGDGSQPQAPKRSD